MPRYTALVALKDASNLAVNDVVNTLAFDDSGIGTDAAGLANDLAQIYVDLWASASGFSSAIDRVHVRFYDAAEPTPREIQGEADLPVTGGGPPGPREVALCLSFYSERNIPRRRGRIYMGPWDTSMAEKPAASQQSILLTHAQKLAALGGADVAWCVHSRIDSAIGGGAPVFRPVTHQWVDDAWDTIRSRGLEATSRLEAAHGS